MVEPESEYHSGRKPRPRGADPNERVSDALTDLIAYALNLDMEYQRLDRRAGELTQEECSVADLRSVLRERAELAEEVQEFRGAIAAFREQLGPQ